MYQVLLLNPLMIALCIEHDHETIKILATVLIEFVICAPTA